MKKIIQNIDYYTRFYILRIKVDLWWNFTVMGTLHLLIYTWQFNRKYRIWDIKDIQMQNGHGEKIQTKHIIFFNP